MAQKLISFAILIAIMCQLSQQNPISDPIEQSRNETYAECNKEKTAKCFGMPDGCVSKEDCVVLLSAKPTDSGADFMMYWSYNASAQDRWVGAALSSDEKMGDDSVTECIYWINKTITVRQGLTDCSNNKCGVKTVEPVQGITKETGTFSDDVLSCSWSRADDTMIQRLDFNIVHQKFYIFLVYGPVGKDDIELPSKIWMSKEAVFLGEDNPTTTPNTTVTTQPTGTTGNSTSPVSTGTPSNSTTPHGNSTTPTSITNSTKIPSTTPSGKDGSATITFNLSLAIFVTIVLSLNL